MGGVVLFDGGCGLCDAAVRFVARRDPRGRFWFAPLGSPAARALLLRCGLAEGERSTLVLVEGGRVSVRSGAVLRIARRLRWPWSLLAAFLVVPPRVRDGAYRLLARHRGRLGRGPVVCDAFVADRMVGSVEEALRHAGASP